MNTGTVVNTQTTVEETRGRMTTLPHEVLEVYEHI